MTPDERIATIRRSLRVFYCGLASLLPFIGVLFGACALFDGLRLRRIHQVNPARRYAKLGLLLGLIGILFTTGLAAAVIVPKLTGFDYGEPGC